MFKHLHDLLPAGAIPITKTARMSAMRTFETLASVKIIEFATQNAFVEYSDELLSY
jgi:hypothetical protein